MCCSPWTTTFCCLYVRCKLMKANKNTIFMHFKNINTKGRFVQTGFQRQLKITVYRKTVWRAPREKLSDPWCWTTGQSKSPDHMTVESVCTVSCSEESVTDKPHRLIYIGWYHLIADQETEAKCDVFEKSHYSVVWESDKYILQCKYIWRC